MVKLVITSEFFGVNETESSIRHQLKNWGAGDISFNVEGFITALMSESRFEVFIENVKNNMNKQLSDIISEYENIKKIQHDNSYINFIVFGDDISKINIKKVAGEIYMIAVVYQIFNGIPQEETSVVVSFKNYKTKKLYDIIEKGAVREA